MKRADIQEGKTYKGARAGIRLVEKIVHQPLGTGPVISIRDRVFVFWRRVAGQGGGASMGSCSLGTFARWAETEVEL